MISQGYSFVRKMGLKWNLFELSFSYWWVSRWESWTSVVSGKTYNNTLTPGYIPRNVRWTYLAWLTLDSIIWTFLETVYYWKRLLKLPVYRKPKYPSLDLLELSSRCKTYWVWQSKGNISTGQMCHPIPKVTTQCESLSITQGDYPVWIFIHYPRWLLSGESLSITYTAGAYSPSKFSAH